MTERRADVPRRTRLRMPGEAHLGSCLGGVSLARCASLQASGLCRLS